MACDLQPDFTRTNIGGPDDGDRVQLEILGVFARMLWPGGHEPSRRGCARGRGFDTRRRTRGDYRYRREVLGGYTLANARVGLAHGAWSASLFVDNLANKVAAITANNTSFQYNIPSLVRYSTNQPRTFGTEMNYRF
jgi:hypothetical protein